MPPKAQPKSKADDLHRIRQNQQRSRERKKAYVAELEAKVQWLEEKLNRAAPQRQEAFEACIGDDGVTMENAARKEMLKALGIDESAQEQFVRAFVKARSGSSGPASGSTRPSSERSSEPASEEVAFQPRNGCSKGCRVSEVHRDTPSDPDPNSLDGRIPQAAEAFASPGPQALVPYTAGSLEASGPAADSSIQLEQQTLWTPCLWNGSMQTSSSCSESTTGCSIAFSMLLSNNSRGYTFSDINERLQAAYRQDNSVAEGCSVLNKVLFQLLSEIS